MSEAQLKAFIAKAKDDQSIQGKLKAAKTPEEVVAGGMGPINMTWVQTAVAVPLGESVVDSF